MSGSADCYTEQQLDALGPLFSPPPAPFVSVRGARFHVDQQTFNFVGTSCHYLLTHSASAAQRPLVLEALDAAQKLRLTVIRAWAFNDGQQQWQALQRAPGIYDEHVFRGLDWLLAQCASRGLRLILSFVNYWSDYGGMRQYLRWAGRTEEQSLGREAEFYEDAACQAMYRAHIAAVLWRINRETGVRYRDDSTIMAWELANEPRCEGDSGAVLTRWIAETAAYVRKLDPHHLITVGSEGFYGASTPELLQLNPYTAHHGVDFAQQSQDPNIDFASIHLYPDHWCNTSDLNDTLTFSRTWIASHAQLCGSKLFKPFVMGEFGKRAPGLYSGEGGCAPVGRVEYYQQVLETCLQNAQHGGPLAGVCFWMLAPPSYPDYDGFTLRHTAHPPASAAPARASTSITDLSGSGPRLPTSKSTGALNLIPDYSTGSSIAGAVAAVAASEVSTTVAAAESMATHMAPPAIHTVPVGTDNALLAQGGWLHHGSSPKASTHDTTRGPDALFWNPPSPSATQLNAIHLNSTTSLGSMGANRVQAPGQTSTKDGSGSSRHRALAMKMSALDWSVHGGSQHGMDPTIRVVSIYSTKMHNLAFEQQMPQAHGHDGKPPLATASFLHRSLAAAASESDSERKRWERMHKATASSDTWSAAMAYTDISQGSLGVGGGGKAGGPAAAVPIRTDFEPLHGGCCTVQ